MKVHNLADSILASLVYSLLGLALFAFAFWVMQKLTPFSFRKEIEHDHNVALAIIIAGVMIGIAIIVGAAISG
ncbi:MAG TPA: DUF350 domain-containing protein [Polyangiaceae bacterium]|nr:DUF350 domain-containing protein [Polyangiaceae bacterium]